MGRGGKEPRKNDTKQKDAFEKRKDAIFKKAQELANLCDAEVSIIIYEGQDQHLHIFPPDPQEFKNSIDRYQQIASERPWKIQTENVFDFYNERKMKIEEDEDAEVAEANVKIVEEDGEGEEVAEPKKKKMKTKGHSEGQLPELALGLEGKTGYAKSKLESFNKASKIHILDILLDVQNPLMTSSSNPVTTKIQSLDHHPGTSLGLASSSNPGLMGDNNIDHLAGDRDNMSNPDSVAEAETAEEQ